MKNLIYTLILVIPCIINSQTIQRKAGLGVALYNNNSDTLFKRLNLKPIDGAVVRLIVPGSNAEILKILPNDIITKINNEDIKSATELIQYAQKLKQGEYVEITITRKNKPLKLRGELVGKPYEIGNDEIKVSYGEFKFENTLIRTITKTPLKLKSKGVIYFIQGISCYSVDNLNSLDPTKQAIDAFVKLGYSVFTAEKLGMGDSYYHCSCNEIGFNKELEVFMEGYKHAINQFPNQKLILFGHSLGGITAPLIAEKFKTNAVIVYGTGLKPWSDYLLDAYLVQSRYYQSDLANLRDTLEKVKFTFYKLFYEAKTKDFAVTDPLAKQASLAILNYNSKSGYFAAERTLQFHQEINQHNLAKAWKNSNTKVLAIYGESDIAANNKFDTEEIARYINELRPGTAEFMFVPKTNHTFQKIGTMQDYVKMETEDPNKYQLFALKQFNHDLFKDIDLWLSNNL